MKVNRAIQIPVNGSRKEMTRFVDHNMIEVMTTLLHWGVCGDEVDIVRHSTPFL